jgi:effector-binding domain-containing protein
MKIIKIISIIIGIILVIFVGIYGYFGGFSNLHFVIAETGGEILIYEELTGSFSKSSEAMDKIYYSLLENEKIETTKGFGIYYDNPAEVEESKLRFDAGCIVENIDESTLAELKTKYKVKIFPKEKYLNTEFPYKGTASIFVAIAKVYPAMNEFVEENNYNETGFVMEIYDIPNEKIIYRKKLNK